MTAGLVSAGVHRFAGHPGCQGKSRPSERGDGHATPQPPRQTGSCPGEQRQAGAVQRDAGRGRARPANAGITLESGPETDRKINLHRRKHGVFEELFKALLHKLMTGEVGMRALDLGAFGGHTG